MALNINNDEIIKLFNSGLSCSAIAREYNCDPETIRLRLKKSGVNTSNIVSNPKCIYCGGDTQKHGKTKRNAIKYKCNSCGKHFNENTLSDIDNRNDRYELIRKMYVEDKMSTVEIAKVLGVTSRVPQIILKNMGVIRTISVAKKGKKIGTKLPVNKVIELYQSGKSTHEIGNIIGFSNSSVINVLKENGVDRDNKYRREHPQLNNIKELYLSGMSMNEVSDKLNIPYTTINANLHKLNIVRTEDKYNLGVPYEEYLKQLPAYKKYKNRVWKLTNNNKLNVLENYDKRALAGTKDGYQLDHRYSISEGFKEGIEPEIIGSIYNLEFIPWEDNLTKGSKCSITKEELIYLYSKATINE